MDRIKVYLLADLARKGIVSLNRTPSTLLLMALNSPRMLEGASGLGSQMSRWLGPPWRKQRITDLALPKGLPRATPFRLAPWTFQDRKWGRLKPNSVAPPTRKNSRRVGPSQHLTFPPGMLNMVASLRFSSRFSAASPVLKHGANENTEKKFSALICVVHFRSWPQTVY